MIMKWMLGLFTSAPNTDMQAITWVSPASQCSCYGPIIGTSFFNRLVTLPLFELILSFQTSNHEENLHEISLISCPSHFHTHICLMANLMPSNLTLSLTVHFHTVHGYAATYMHITCFMLLFHSATTMQLHYVPYLDMPFLYSINRFNTNMYIPYDSI